MSRYSEKLREILSYADSKKITDKRKCYTNLLEFYENKDAIMEICKNSEESHSGMTSWSYVLHVVHKLLINVADRIAVKSTDSKVAQERNSLCKLILETIKAANNSAVKPLLKCSDIIAAVLEILSQKVYEHYHGTYMLILVTYVLTSRIYRVKMQLDHWKELLKVCIAIHENGCIHVNKKTMITAIRLIIQYGCIHSNLTLEVKSVLPLLVKLFLDAKSNEVLVEHAYELASVICYNIGTECRISLCKFSEEILPVIISLPNSKEKYKLLVFLVEIHHPRGLTMQSDVAYAVDSNKWRTILQSIYSVILRDCNHNLLPESFMHLAAIVIRQILADPVYSSDINLSEESVCVQPMKRRRNMTIETPIDLIVNQSSNKAWPMVQILRVLFEKHPECVKPNDIEPFLKVLTQLLSQSNKHESIMDSIYELATVLMNIEAGQFLNVAQMENNKRHWDKIWDTLLRSLSMHQSENAGHKLLQLFIRYNKMPNANALLRLYVTHTFKFSSNAVHTLRVFCKYVPLPDDQLIPSSCSLVTDSESVRLRCLKWVLNIPWNQVINNDGIVIQKATEDISQVLLCIICKSWIKGREKIGNDSLNCIHNIDSYFEEEDICNNYGLIPFHNVEHSYLSSMFQVDLVKKEKADMVPLDEKVNVTLAHLTDIRDFLSKSLHNTIEECKSSSDVSTRILMIAFVSKILSALNELKIFSDLVREVQTVLKCSLESIYTLLSSMDLAQCKFRYLIKITRALNVLYGSSYDHETAGIIISTCTWDLLNKIFDLLNIEDRDIADYDEVRSYYEEVSKSKNRECISLEEGIIRKEASKALTLFCCMDVGDAKCDLQMKIMENLLMIDMYDLTSIVDFKMAVTVIDSLIKYDNRQLYKRYIQLSESFLLRLYEKCYKDVTCARCILNTLPKFLEYMKDCSYPTSNIKTILFGFLKHLSHGRCGPLFYAELIKCLSLIVQTDQSIVIQRDDESESLAESIMTYINSPYYIVRLQMIQFVQELFFLKDIDFEWKSLVFDKLKKEVSNLSMISGNIGPDDIKDEKETRKATALLIFGSIICSNGVLQARALFSMLKLANDKFVKVQTIQKIIDAIEKQMNYPRFIEDNLSYLLSRWIDSKYPLDSFPWTLTRCNSQDEFYQKYINILAVIEIRMWSVNNLRNFCDCIHVSFEHVFEDIFPEVFVLLLSSICGNVSTVAESQRAMEIYHQLVLNQGEFESVERFSNLFRRHLGKIIYSIVRRLHDEAYFEQVFCLQMSFPISDPPSFTKVVLDDSLRYIEENFYQNKSLQFALATRNQCILQKVLLNLTSDIYNARFEEHKVKAFHQYVYFCMYIVEKIQEDYFNAVSMFIIREIGYTLLNLVKKNSGLLSELACKYLFIFFKRVLPARSREITEILSFCITILVPFVQVGNFPVALEILEFLIIEHQHALSSAIEKLDAFPNVPAFKKLREVHHRLKYKSADDYNLERQIQHFLNAMDNKNLNCSVEGLLWLKHLLSTQKNELQDMYKSLETLQGFAEDCAISTLHQLIYTLVKLTSSSNCAISMEAAKCLGELGPADLTTTILHFGESCMKESTNPMEVLTCKIINMLTEFLIRDDIELRIASAKALYDVLQSFWGYNLINTGGVNDPSTSLKMALRTDYLQPFIQRINSKTASIEINNVKFNNFMNPDNPIWTLKSNGLYTEWIVEVTCNMAECISGTYLENLIPVSKLNTEFCELILARIIFVIMYTDKRLVKTVCACINQFFHYHFDCINRPHKTRTTSQLKSNCDHKMVQCMLNVVNFIRIQAADNIPLNLNYIYIANAAQYCSAYFTAFLYTELSFEALLDDSYDFSSIPKIDYICEEKPVQGRVLQNILQDTCSKIGDLDAIYGCGSSHLTDPYSRVQHYVHMQKWDKVLLAQDIELCFGNDAGIRQMVNAMGGCGLQYLLGHFALADHCGNVKIMNEFQYESAWRLSNWDIQSTHRHSLNVEPSVKVNMDEAGYYFHHYQALKCFHENDDSGVKDAIMNARTSIINALHNISLESSKTIYEKLTKLQMLREIEEFSLAKPDGYNEVLTKWQNYNIVFSNEFQYTEPILTQRAVLFQMKNVMSKSIVKSTLAKTYMEIANIAEKQGYLHVAARALGALAKQQDLPPEIHHRLNYQEGLLAWKRNDQDIGRVLLRNLMHKKSLDKNLQAQILRVYGNWVTETKSENPQMVIQKYYLESEHTINSISRQDQDTIKNLTDTQVALAQFADAQFDQISEYMKSPQFESLKRCVQYYQSLPKMDTNSKDKDLRKAAYQNRLQSTNDVVELENIQKEKSNYLLLALRYYLGPLQQSEHYNLLIFRLIALWLDNRHDTQVNELLRDNLERIPSYKFIPLVPQLAAHMSNVSDEFSKLINDILERCALEHPHHSLNVLLALKNLYSDHPNVSGKITVKRKEEPRILGARKLLEGLTNSKIGEIIQKMEKLSHSLVTLANHQVEKGNASGNVRNIPANQPILQIKDLDNVLVPTLSIDIKANGNYNNIVGIQTYQKTFETVGGINVPKKIICVGSDGVHRKQLVKGQDDLRQDAVMQQVFNVMNILLNSHKETKRRKLKIRTYKVVPLTQRSGVLEWCDNTIPILQVLTGPDGASGAHKKYYPKDYTGTACRQKMIQAQHASNDVKLKVFMDICKHFHPAFHYYFMDQFPSPETWFERRSAYTRSVATTSMAGYILGLGDRHLSNILIDQLTAEVVHIDFGIAFEQGKLLPVPETVPFRLTRDIEAAMGISGVEGIMRRSCEETLSVLRDQRQIINTLLQVLLYDPLFSWTITPAKVRTLQSRKTAETSECNTVPIETNKNAERALLRIEQKLQGTEEGVVSSVPGQVERLIQQARDPTNLCRVYFGWQPYL